MRATILLGLLVIGCSCGAPREPSTTPTAPTTPETPPSAPPDEPAGPSTYSVHEWGLVRSGPRDTLAVGAIGPAALPQYDLQVVEKPVLYFHLAGRSPLALTTASVTAIDGEIREHWPFTGVAATPMPTTIAWGPLTIETERCGVSVPIDRSAMPCAALPPGEACESLELARVVSDDASCARIGDSATPFLFYRSTSRGLTVPVGAFYLDFDDINVTNTGTLPIPGRMFRFQRYRGETRVLVFDPPAPGQTILVNHTWGDAVQARAALTATIVGLGLTEGEAAAFAASWEGAFFGAPPAAEDVVEERSVEHAEESPGPEDSVLYFLPPAMVESVARWTLEPPPTEVRRAMAVWTAL